MTNNAVNKGVKKIKDRNASLDLLRVLAMLMIVLGHAFSHGGISNFEMPWNANIIISKVMTSFLSVHVNCFVLVSGYFLCTSEFKLGKWFKLWASALFWSVAIFFAFGLLGKVDFGVTNFLKAFMPFTQQRYWFVTTYLLMYLLSPVCNAAINQMNKYRYLLSLVVFFVVYILLQNVFFWKSFTSMNAYDPMFFLFLYFTAAFVRKYPPKNKHAWIIGYIVCMGISATYSIAEPLLSQKIFGQVIGETALSGITRC